MIVHLCYFLVKVHIPVCEEYTPLCECFSISFIKDYLPLCKLKNIHLCASVFQFFPWRISTFVKVDKNGIFYTWKCNLSEWYTPLRKLTKTMLFTHKNVFFPKNIRLCTIIHLCDFFTWSIYTSVWWYKFVIFFTWSIYTSVLFYLNYIHLIVIINLQFLLEVYTPLRNYTHLWFFSEVQTPIYDFITLWFFPPEVYTYSGIKHLCDFLPEVYTPLCDYTHLWFFHLKYIHLCDFLPYFLLKTCNFYLKYIHPWCDFITLWFFYLNYIHLFDSYLKRIHICVRPL